MAKRTWILLDVEDDQYTDEIRLTSADADGVPEGISIVKRRLRGGLRDGVDVIEVDNGVFRFVVVPTRGMGIHRATLGQVRLGWQSPMRGPVHPSLVNLQTPDGLGWLDGFDELLARCGLQSNGSPVFDDNGTLRWPLHGKIQNTPAHEVKVSIDDASGEVTVSGTVDECRPFGNKLRLRTTYTTNPGEPGVRFVDTVTNLSAEPGQLQLLYHINFGAPLVDAGAKLVAPVAKVAPQDASGTDEIPTWDTYQPPTPHGKSFCLFYDLLADGQGQTRAVLQNAAGTQGVSILFNKNQLPCFTQWKDCQATADGYVTGLEPGTNFPNERTFEQQKGRVITLEPGESRSFELALEAHATAESVAAAKEDVARLQAGSQPEILSGPDPEWSPT